MNIKRLSIDLSKDVFQLYGVNEANQSVLEKRITSREKFAEFVAKISPCEIVMEACGSANYLKNPLILSYLKIQPKMAFHLVYC